MGWASGSEIAENVWGAIVRSLPKKSRKRVARRLIEIFEDRDCDTIDECETLCKAAGRYFKNDEYGDPTDGPFYR